MWNRYACRGLDPNRCSSNSHDALPHEHGCLYDHHIDYHVSRGRETATPQWFQHRNNIGHASHGNSIENSPGSGNYFGPQIFTRAPYGSPSTSPPSYTMNRAVMTGFGGIENLGNVSAPHLQANGHHCGASSSVLRTVLEAHFRDERDASHRRKYEDLLLKFISK